MLARVSISGIGFDNMEHIPERSVGAERIFWNWFKGRFFSKIAKILFLLRASVIFCTVSVK